MFGPSPNAGFARPVLVFEGLEFDAPPAQIDTISAQIDALPAQIGQFR